MAMGDADEREDRSALKTVFVGRRATAKRLRQGLLTVVDGPDEGRTFHVRHERSSLGRSPVNDFPINDPSVSNLHAELLLSDRGVLLRDMGSTNGTHYGDLRLGEAYLSPGVRFRIGNTSLRYDPSDEFVEVALSGDDRFYDVIGRSVRMREIFALLEKVAPSDLTVLIEGETGTGKDRVARAVHARSPRARAPFVVLDCSAIPPNLMESTLFGHERGSFTGAVERRRGLFEEAEGGTIFLDEIGELDMTLQPKLLRVLENRELKRVGGNQTLRSNVRVLAATNRDLRKLVTEGRFRQDLYFRLSVVHAELPALRARVEDIPLLVDEFLRLVEHPRFGPGSTMSVTPQAIGRLCVYTWPGNVRELRNVVERAVAMADSSVLDVSDFFPDSRNVASGPPARSQGLLENLAGRVVQGSGMSADLPFKEAKRLVLQRFETEYLRELVERNEGNVSRSARASGLTRFHLRELLKKHGLTGD